MGSVGKAIGNAFGDIAGGLANSSGAESHFQGTPAQLQMQTDLINQIQAAQGGLGGVNQNQNALGQALLAQSQGQGPNPAQLMLNQATQNNAHQAAGMVASQKGINPAMAARMAGQQSAMGGQQAAGQGALMQAQQQLAAQQQLGSLYGQQANQQLGQQQMLQQALSSQNQANIQNTLGAQGLTQQTEAANAQARAGITGGLMGGVGSAAQMMVGKGKADGGRIEAGGSYTDYSNYAAQGGRIDGTAEVPGDSYQNDKVHTMLSPGEIVIPRSKAGDPDAAKAFIDSLMAREGKKKRKA